MRGTIHVLTFKEGLFAKLAHDLQLSLSDFEATLEAGAVHARFRLASLSVDGVARGGQVDTHTLSDSDKLKIHDTIASEILETRAHPDASFDGTARELSSDRVSIEGRLSLHGVTQPCSLELRAGATATAPWTGELTLTPSRYGIAPYKALGGAIRLADRIVVRVSIAVEGADPRALLAAQRQTRIMAAPS